ncbi:MAG: AraC family transcriptional regulator [Spirochaetes bacterium]|nr:MAG: AraC family transcriptional regulator [Spirochaetota bacterium]
MHGIKSITFIILYLSVIFISCASEAERAETPRVILREWTVDIGNGPLPSGPVPWDFPAEKGGIGASRYDGYGTYRTRVSLPRSLARTQLALFIQGADDADETRFNGVLIGATGVFPGEGAGNRGFIPAWRTPRVYPIPQSATRYEEPNIIEVKVFDHSGRGGLVGDYPPEIAGYDILSKRAVKLSLQNDTPRLVSMTFIGFLIAYLILRLITRSAKPDFRYMVKRAANGLNPVYFVQTVLGRRPVSYLLTQEESFKYLCSLATLGSFFLFSFFELTVKDIFLLPGLVPVRYHVPILYFGLTALILLLHQDTFSARVVHSSGPRTVLRITLGMISHPFFFCGYFLFACMLPENQLGNDFTVRGSFFVMVIVMCMLARSLLIGMRFVSGNNWDPYIKMSVFESALRMFLLAGSVAALLAFIAAPNLLFVQATAIGSLFVASYIALNLRLERNRYVLYRSLEEKTKLIVRRVVSAEEKIKRVTAFIDENYAQDITRDDIALAVGLTPDQLSRSFHLCTGKTVVEYVSEARLRNSTRMLAETEKTVIEIAFHSGFNSLRTFNRAFAKRMKTSPTNYRAKERARGDARPGNRAPS